jgi:superfamily II DNA or RNA helicase
VTLTNPGFKLRDYQREAVDHVLSRWNNGDVRVPIVLATGLGKTQIFTTLIDEWLAANPGRRALVIAHTDELIEQAAKRMRQVAPGRRVGIVKAARNEVLAEIVVSSRQTLATTKRRSQINHVGLIVIDECHHAVRHNTYGKILEHFGAFDESVGIGERRNGQNVINVLGVTATLARSDKAKLSTVWQSATFSRDILFGIRRGYLLDVRGERITVPDLDLSRVRISGGDYSDGSLGEELERTFAPEVIAESYAKLARHPGADVPLGPQYRRGIAFWPLVAVAQHGADAFNDVGIRSAMICGETPKPERRALLQRFHLPLAHPEAIDVMHNAMVLTEGFDEPTADVVVIARPTKSAPLFQQMVGRVLRPNLEIPPEQREKALILDVAGAGQDHGLRTLIDLSPERNLQINPNDPDASLLELDEYLDATLAELEEQRVGAAFSFEGAEEYRGETVSVAFDPLGRDKVWGSTPAGYHFVSAGGTAYVFLAPSVYGDPGTYDVVLCSKNNYVRDGVAPWQRGTEHQGLPLEMALNWAEDVAVQVGGPGALTLAKRKSAWRKADPTEAQMKMAFRLHIPGVNHVFDHYETQMSKGELSEAIDAVHAARRIDPLVAAVMAVKAMHDESERQKADMGANT